MNSTVTCPVPINISSPSITLLGTEPWRAADSRAVAPLRHYCQSLGKRRLTGA